MRTLLRAVDTTDPVGDPIPTPWRQLNELVTLRTQELVLVAGGPGGGKSTLAVNLAHAANYPVLYFAQDTPASVKARLAALETNHKTSRVYQWLNDPEQRNSVVRGLTDLRKTLIIEEGTVDVAHIRNCILALTEWIGHSPPLIVVDNLIDLTVEGYHYQESGFYASTLPELKQLAHETNTCMMLLHHVTRSGDGKKHGQGNQPMKLTDLLQAGERTARHVWGVYNPSDSEIRVQVLKNQDGPAKADGELWVGLRWVPPFTKLVGEA